jgi:hypothetical protein
LSHVCNRYVLVLLGFLVLTGVNTRLSAEAPSTQPARAHAAWKEGQSVRYRITVKEDRESTDPRLGAGSLLSMSRTLHVRLKVLGRDSAGLQMIRGVFDRIEVSGRSDGRPIDYDSDQDRPGKGNAVADLLSNVVNVEFQIQVLPNGAFKRVSGLDAAWRKKGLLAPPPAMLAIQFLFRDQAVYQLLGEVISPPVPTDAAGKGSTYEDRLPLEVPFVTMLTWPAVFTVVGTERVVSVSCVHVTAKGGLEIARPPGDVGTAGLRATVVEGQRQSDLYLASDSMQVIRNAVTQDVVLSLKLKPPAGGDSPSMTLRQRIRITAERVGK